MRIMTTTVVTNYNVDTSAKIGTQAHSSLKSFEADADGNDYPIVT